MVATPGSSQVSSFPPRTPRRASIEYTFVDLFVAQPDAADPARLLLPKSIDSSGQILGNRAVDEGDVPMLAERSGSNRLRGLDRSFRAAILTGVGLAGRSTVPGSGRAGVFHDGVWAELPLPGPLDEECCRSFVGAIGEDGRVTGWMTLRDGGALPLLWDDDGVRVLPPIGALTHAYPASALDDGAIGGEARGLSGEHLPIVWSNGEAALLPAPATYGRVLAGSRIRSAHLGSAWNGVRFDAAIWINDQCDVLPALPGASIEAAAYGLNSANTAVGVTWRSPARSDWTATRWSNGHVDDLNELIAPDAGARLISANAINDAGQIAAAAIWADGSLHVVRLDPC